VRSAAWHPALLVSLLGLACGAHPPAAPLSLYPAPATAPRDPNGLLLNPAWWAWTAGTPPDVDEICRFRVATGHLEQRTLMTTRGPCLSPEERRLVTLSEAPTVLGLGLVCATNSRVGTVRGHINWFPVTATGQFRNAKFSGGAAADHDVTMNLAVPPPHALTTGNVREDDAYHLEYHVAETLARLPEPAEPTLWHALRNALPSAARLRAEAAGRFAIVTGLYGVDAVHSHLAELHPVYAMAVLMDTAAGGRRETWALMVRNRGNEGDCSAGQFPLTLGNGADATQHYALDLGWWPGAAGAAVALGPSWASDTAYRPAVRADPAGGHLFLVLEHPRPRPVDGGFVFLGTVTVAWEPGGAGPSLARLDQWRPAGDSLVLGPPRVDSVPYPRLRRLWDPVPATAPAASLLRDAAAEAESTLVRHEARPLAPAPAAWSPAAARRPEPVVPWSPATPVAANCVRQKRPTDPLCLSGWRWSLMPGLTTTGGARFTPLVSVTLASHGWAALRSLGTVGDILSTLTYRLDVRWDRFQAADSAGVAAPPADNSWGARLGIVHSPLPFRLSSAAVITFYATGTAGVAFLHSRAGFTWGAGGGLHVQVHHLESVIELQHYGRRGARSQFTLSLGVLLARPFFQ